MDRKIEADRISLAAQEAELKTRSIGRGSEDGFLFFFIFILPNFLIKRIVCVRRILAFTHRRNIKRFLIVLLFLVHLFLLLLPRVHWRHGSGTILLWSEPTEIWLNFIIYCYFCFFNYI